MFFSQDAGQINYTFDQVSICCNQVSSSHMSDWLRYNVPVSKVNYSLQSLLTELHKLTKLCNVQQFQTSMWHTIAMVRALSRRMYSYVWDVKYLWPKSNVDLVSTSLNDAGEQQITIVVRALPPRLSCSMRVNLLSRYGTYVYTGTSAPALIGGSLWGNIWIQPKFPGRCFIDSVKASTQCTITIHSTGTSEDSTITSLAQSSNCSNFYLNS